MRSSLAKIILEMAVVISLGLWLGSCGSQPHCPTCGTTVNGAYAVLNVVPVPEHNPTGEPGGPFNSFDISWFDPIQQKVYTSDRIGLDVVVTDAAHNFAVNTIGGLNQVANAGNNGSPCWGQAATEVQAIPSIVTGLGSVNNTRPGNGLTRFGCRNAPFFAAFGTAFPGFGPNGFFGGVPGAQCCASRANGVNPLSGPNGLLVTPDGKTLFVGSGSASVVVFDLTTNPPEVIADFPTGSSPDFDGPSGVGPCIASWNGGAGSAPECADDRADEMAYGTVGGHDILTIANGVPCPNPSTSVPSGLAGTFTLAETGGTITIPCHHSAIVDANTGAFITSNGSALAGQQGEIAVAGTGAVGFNPLHGTFYLENLNCTVSNLATQSSVAVGCIDEIDPRIGNPNGPVVINVVPTLQCMPAGIVQGPGHDFFVGCGGHDGVQFPPLLIIFDGTCTTSAACSASEVQITQSGGTDQVWYNPGDNRYYTAGRDMPNGPVLGVVDAVTRQWLVNVTTGSNSHSVTVNQFTNQIFVPTQSGALCGTQSSNGCIAVYGRQ